MSGERTYTASQALDLEDRSDWARVRALTDAEIEAAMRDDPDWAEFMDLDWSDAVLVAPGRNKAVPIELDEDVIEFFRAQGGDFEGRISAVLRHFVDRAKRSAAAE